MIRGGVERMERRAERREVEGVWVGVVGAVVGKERGGYGCYRGQLGSQVVKVRQKMKATTYRPSSSWSKSSSFVRYTVLIRSSIFIPGL